MNLSVRTALTLLLVAQTLVVGFTVGALSLRQGHAAVDELASELATEVGHRVDGRIAAELHGPPLLNELNHDAIAAGELDLFGPTEPLEAVFFRHVRRFDVSLTYIGTQRGDYIGARRVGEGEYTISLVNASTDFKNERFSTDMDGHRVERLIRSDDVYDPRLRPWYAPAAAAETPAWTDVYMDYTSGALGITAARAVRGPDREVQGVLATDLLLSDLDAFLRSLEVGRTGLVYIVDDQGRLVSTSTDAPLFVGPKGEHDRVRASESSHPVISGAAAALGERTSGTLQATIAGQATILQVAPYVDPMGLDWSVVVAIPRSDFTAHIDANLRNTLVICLVAMLLAMLVGLLATRRLTAALAEVSDEMGAVGQFDIRQRSLSPSALHEVGVMHDALSRMKGGLRSFQRYVPVELVRQLLEQRTEAVLGAEPKELTVLFSDIAGFTPMVESTPPEVVVETLGAYLEQMNGAVASNDGTVCQYLGDGILALWGAPVDQQDHAVRACRGALEMAERSRALERMASSLGRPALPTRIGVNSGETVVGNIGAPERFNYAAIGDAVNTASRIEGLSKVYGTEVLIGQATRELIGDQFTVRVVDRVRMKGKAKPVRVYELLAEGPVDAAKREWIAAYEAAFDAYQAREFGAARARFEALPDAASSVLAKRCAAYEEQSPGQDWDGTFQLLTK
ncbi:MAG: hypothetical protein KC912_12175 [Proteobacteria bacterium]|nr:hypothetical protein [Pseudomonadota bacterium]